jgi:hypothetical protein
MCEFGIVMAVYFKITVVWNMTPCSLVYRYQSFGET